VPALLLHRLLGDFADELLLGGQRVLPDKAQLSGFNFRHETLRDALAAMFGRPGRTEADTSLLRPTAPERAATDFRAA
jgi:hypothetical protein